MSNDELQNVVGGIAWTSAFLSAITKAVTTIYDIAKRFGSSYVRAKTGNVCAFWCKGDFSPLQNI